MARARSTKPPQISRFLRASLAPSLPDVEGLQFEALYLPYVDNLVGGDWYDAIPLADGSVAVSVGDVTGHGLEAAAIMGKIRYSTRVVALRRSPLRGGTASILPDIEEALRSEHPDATASMFLGIISPDRTRMQYATAGHPPQLVVKHSGEAVWLEAGDAPLGCGYGHIRGNHHLDLAGVSRLILYTDGLIEAGRDVILGLERLQNAVQDPNVAGANDLLPRVVDTSLVGPPHDDITMLAVTFD